MRRLLLLGATVCAIAVLPSLPAAAAMPFGSAAPAMAQSDNGAVLVKGGRGRGHHMKRGNNGRHLGWTRGRHRGWR